MWAIRHSGSTPSLSNFHDVNFRSGDPLKWVIASGPIVASGETAQFYSPIIADPSPVVGTIFEGSRSVWRIQDWGGNRAYLEANCPEFTTSGANPASGDFVAHRSGWGDEYDGEHGRLPRDEAGGRKRGCADSSASSDTNDFVGGDDDGTRVYIEECRHQRISTVTYTRLDSLSANSPGRFVSGIFVDPYDPNQAWNSYSSYSSLTPSTPGHVFSVTYNPAGAGTATWTALDGSGGTAFPDFPATGIAQIRSAISTSRMTGAFCGLPSGSSDWEVAGTGLPMVEVVGLTIVPSARKLYAATHGRSAWLANIAVKLV